jgi:hypothetical protein
MGAMTLFAKAPDAGDGWNTQCASAFEKWQILGGMNQRLSDGPLRGRRGIPRGPEVRRLGEDLESREGVPDARDEAGRLHRSDDELHRGRPGGHRVRARLLRQVEAPRRRKGATRAEKAKVTVSDTGSSSRECVKWNLQQIYDSL